MRRGDKLASYRVLADSLAMLSDLDWSLDLVGDGEARGEVAAAFAALSPRIRWRGALDESAVAAALADSDLFVWPAVNEAFGMALLEAQASGLPVVAGAVAGASGGVGGIVADRETGLLVPPGDPCRVRRRAAPFDARSGPARGDGCGGARAGSARARSARGRDAAARDSRRTPGEAAPREPRGE